MTRVILITLSKAQKFAETEVASRMKRVLQSLGLDVAVISVDELNSTESIALFAAPDTLFSICLHASIPKTWIGTSYLCLWDPFPWLKTGKYLANMLTHDDYLVIDSPSMLTPLRQFLIRVIPNTEAEFLPLLPSVSKQQAVSPKEPVNRKLFYCGIGGENIFHRQTRLRDILKQLDPMNLVDLYGPRTINGPGNKPYEPWKGYQSYQGEIPFDGDSLIRVMSQSGISLVVSSETHRREGIPSARIFEACASGNVIIADDTAYFDRWGDSIYRISFKQSDQQIVASLIKIIQEINQHPARSHAMAVVAQTLFFEHYSLEAYFDNLMKQYGERAKFQQAFAKAKQQQSIHHTVYQFLRFKDCPSLKLKIKYLADKYHLNFLYNMNDWVNQILIKSSK